MAGSSDILETRIRMSDGCHLFVQLLGGKNAHQKPLLIEHQGALGISTHKLGEFATEFLASEYRVLNFDARGCGESEHVEPYTHDRFVEDIDELRQWVGVDRFILSGGSHGTPIVLDYALKHQKHLLGLHPWAGWADGRWGLMNALAQCMAASDRVTTPMDQLVRLWSGNARDDEDLATGFAGIGGVYAKPAEANEEQVTLPPIKFYSYSRTHNLTFHELLKWEVLSKLDQIKVPTLVMSGKYDPVCPASGGELIAQGIQGAQYVLFEKSGHLIPMEEKNKWERELGRWLKSLGTP